MRQPLTRDLGTFVAGLRFEQLPAGATAVIRRGFTDLVGCMIAGRNDAAPQILRDALQPREGGATLMFTGIGATLPEAVLINGTAGHALDYDDARLRGHVSAALVPAILALGETLGRSGADMATAYAAGYETWAELAGRDPGQHHMKGWHPTGIFGPIAAAAACASLLRLDAEQTTTALALGASHSAGVMANFGSMTKPYHAGRAGHSGLMAARLAAAGFSASPDAIEHTQGFLAAVSPNGDFDVETPCAAGANWRLTTEGLNVKKYPVCYCAHRSLDAALDLLAAQPTRADDVESIVVRISGRNARILRNHAPQTGLAAKFSIEFAMASAVIAGRVGLAEVDDPFVQRAETQALMQRVTVDPDQREDPLNGYAPFDQVTIHTKDGRTLVSAPVTVARGATEAPLSDDELWIKFEDCLHHGAYAGAPRALFDAMMRIDTLSGPRDIPGLLCSARALA
jgi:2-methylcitrate dehydratase PrpD